MASVLDLLDNDSMGIDKDNIQNIITLITGSDLDKNVNSVNIDPVDANRYKGNFYGLLKNVLNVPNSAIYFNMLINGYTSSLGYEGSLQVKIIDANIAQKILVFLQEAKTLKANIGF